MDRLMDVDTGFVNRVLFQWFMGFFRRVSNCCRPSVAYRTPAKISHRLYLKLSHRK